VRFIQATDLRFNIDELRSGLSDILSICDWHSSHNQIGLTHSLDSNADAAWYDGTGSLIYAWGNDPFDQSGNLKKNQITKKESDFVHFVREFENTVFKNVYDIISTRYNLGRIRLMRSRPKSCLSWHADSEKRLHIPIITNLGAHLVIEDTANHLPADGTAYIADTTKYHTAFNAGLDDRIHLVACLLD
jgi:hypothetical protein